MLKNKLLAVLVLIMMISFANAQKGEQGGKVYVGYNIGKFNPGMGNMLSTINCNYLGAKI